MKKASLIVRPKGKCEATVEQFKRSGLPAFGLPIIQTIAIESGIEAFAHLMATQPIDILIFVSTNAAQPVKPYLEQACLEGAYSEGGGAMICCVGSSTARRLSSLNCQLRVPKDESSEGLLALNELKDVADKRIVIVKGEGGRTLLQEELAKRGAKLSCFDVYKRRVVEPEKLDLSWQNESIEYVIVTSVELLKATLAHFEKLIDKHWIVSSERIAKAAKTLGIQTVTVTISARSEDLIAAINQLEA